MFELFSIKYEIYDLYPYEGLYVNKIEDLYTV